MCCRTRVLLVIKVTPGIFDGENRSLMLPLVSQNDLNALHVLPGTAAHFYLTMLY
jgi:hypothetical protein